MTDQNSQFFAILTAVGEAKQANANALGVPWTFAQMGVGDANNTDPVPSRTQTKLINERRRAALNQISVDPKNSNIIIAEQVIPPDEGGWWIREIGLYDAAGDLVAVANCAPSFKPLLSQGTGKTQVVRLNLIVTSTANVQLKIDPAVVLATREYVDSSIISVLPKNKVAGTYTKVRINDRGVVQEGSNPTTLEEYGIVNALKVGVTSYQRPILSGLGSGSAAESGGAIEIREAQEVGASNKSIAYAPRIMMHWTGVISGDIAMDSQGQLQWKAQRLYHEGNFNPATKADKATTLGGYGINDAMPKGAGGLLTQAATVEGRLSAIPETRFVATSPATEDRPAGVNYAAGVHVTWGGGEQCIDFLGALNGQEDFFVRSCYLGAGTFRKLWTEANFTPALKANLASPTFTGIPRVPTAAVGTVTDQAASTEFVQKALGNLTGEPTVLGANTVLTAAQAGGLFIVGGAYQTTLPALSSVPAGSAFHFLFTGSGATLKGSGAEGIQGITGGNQYLPLIGEKVTLVKRSNAWYLAGGGLGAEAFLCSMGVSGYQKFPSGLILQWGSTAPATGADQTHTLPIAFPNSFLKIFITQGYTAGSGSLGYASAGVSTSGAFIWRGSVIGNGSQFFALGS